MYIASVQSRHNQCKTSDAWIGLYDHLMEGRIDTQTVMVFFFVCPFVINKRWTEIAHNCEK